jgi:hypothetical protein
MEFYAAIKKNEILSLTGQWMEIQNIIISEVSRFRRPKVICSPSDVDCRPKTNAVILLDMGHILKGNYTQVGKGKGKKPKT